MQRWIERKAEITDKIQARVTLKYDSDADDGDDEDADSHYFTWNSLPIF